MNLDLLRVISTYVSVLAVVISIVSLASQVRRHNHSLHAQNYSKALDRLAAVQSRLGADPDAARMFNTGVRDAAALTPEERIRFTWIFYEIFGSFEFMFDEARRRRLPPHVWERWSKTLGWWIAMPGVQAWWRGKPTPFTPDFSKFVDQCIEIPCLDVASAKRWLTFLEGEAPRKATFSTVDGS
jgi:hypothetical protein